MWGKRTFLECLDDDASTLHKDTARIQTDIGIEEFVKGRIATQWKVVQTRYKIESGYNMENANMEAWNAGLIRQIYYFAQSMWTQRNEKVSELNTKLETRKEKRKTESQINKLFQHSEMKLRASDRYLIHSNTKQDILKLKVPERKMWIKSVMAAKNRFHRLNAQSMTDMRRRMESFVRGDG